MKKLDAAIIGAGPAGLTAGIYLGRARLKTFIFEKAFAGGQMAVSEWVENFPGFDEGIAGMELSRKMRQQAIDCGSKIVIEEAVEIKQNKQKNFIIRATGPDEYQAEVVIIAAGAVPKKLGIPGEDKFTGRGVSYCATCDAPLFKEKTVVVVGGGDTAAQEALFLAKYCKKVYLVHRRGRLRAVNILSERLVSCKKIELILASIVTEIIGGDGRVKRVNIKGAKEGIAVRSLDCDGVFIFSGIAPNSYIAKGLVELDKDGYIITDEQMKASVNGIFACGDIRKKSLRQIVTACGEAAVAAVSAQHYIETLRGIVYI